MLITKLNVCSRVCVRTCVRMVCEYLCVCVGIFLCAYLSTWFQDRVYVANVFS